MYSIHVQYMQLIFHSEHTIINTAQSAHLRLAFFMACGN